MKIDDLEFRLSQYLDGTLDAAEQAEVERSLAEDGQARALLEQYRKLDGALKSMPLPEVRWEALAAHISRAVDEDQIPQRRLAMPWVIKPAAWQRVTRWAVAAVVVLASALAVQTYLGRGSALNKIGSDISTGQIVAEIQGPQIEIALGKPVDDIEIGPGNASADGQNDWSSAQAIVGPESRLVIASGAQPVQDTLQLPY